MIFESQILIAGGAGFIGSHLCQRLFDAGNEIIVLDNLSTGNRKNIEPFLREKNFYFIHEDVTGFGGVDVDIDFVFNLACPASPVHYQKEPIQTLMTSVQGTYNLLELTMDHSATMIQASTSEIYGDPLQHPQTESYWGNVNPIGPRACYDEGKRAAETLCFDHHRTYGTDVRVARIFNTYGPNMQADDGRVVSNFIRQALLGRPLTVYGDGLQTRSLCYVSDLVDALIRFADPFVKEQLFNFGNPTEITMLELAEKVIKLTKTNSKIEFRPLPEDDPKKRKPDISQANDRLNWRPKVKLDDGLEMTIEYFRKEISCLQ